VVLRNPIWARPFELFERLLGIPAASEADPSTILALLVPLMFGFMFGDVGQGALLVLAGLLLGRRYPAVRLLVPCGLAAMFFGALFGSVFTREDLLPALWLHPLARPLLPLLVSLVFGAGVLTMGLGLDALQHRWAGEALLWWRTRAGLLVAYLGMLGCALSPRALWAVGAGLVWFWLGSSLGPGDRIARLGGAIAESIETVLQLFVNTLSFVRIGAFALAHAGLAGAIHALAAGVSSRLAAFIVLTMGNVAVIVVEGLIVGIQTTRLVLFEFFIRFLHGAGRAFRPLPPPQLPVQPGR
jgi:V/A-type H+-transporting ATPase subunit I